MNLTTIGQNIAAASVLIPFIMVLWYLFEKGTTKKFKAVWIGIYVCLMVLTQALMMFFAFQMHNNLLIVRIYLTLEVIFVIYFFLSYQFKEQITRILFTGLLVVLVFSVDLIWGNFSAPPIEIFMVESLLFTILGMLTIPEITMEEEYENGFYYFIFAILLYAVNNLIGRGFIQLVPSFSLNVHAVATVIKNLLIAKAFYIFIKKK